MSQSQKGFSHFWHYNKGKIFFVAFFLMLIAIAFSQCSLGTSTDLGILYVSPYENVDSAKFTEQIKKDIPFSTTQEEPTVVFTDICLPADPSLPVQSGLLDKMHVEMVTGDSTFFIIDEETIFSYEKDGFFHDITSYADKFSIPEEDRYYGTDGKVIAISADSNSYVESTSVKTGSLFFAVRAHTDDDAQNHKNAFMLLEHVLTNK